MKKIISVMIIVVTVSAIVMAVFLIRSDGKRDLDTAEICSDINRIRIIDYSGETPESKKEYVIEDAGSVSDIVNQLFCDGCTRKEYNSVLIGNGVYRVIFYKDHDRRIECTLVNGSNMIVEAPRTKSYMYWAANDAHWTECLQAYAK